MINIAFRLLLTINATSLLLIVFLVHKGYTLSYFFSTGWLLLVPDMFSYAFYFMCPVLLTGVSIILSPFLGKDEFRGGEVYSIEHANNSFLPSYLGYFFVALSIGNWETLGFVYCVLFLFTFLSQALYFNPLFLVFGYEFYNVETQSGTRLFLISRAKYKRPDEVEVSVAYRINDYTFIERGW